MSIIAIMNGKSRILSDGESANPFEFVLIDPSDLQINNVMSSQIIGMRDIMLRGSDWTQVADTPLDTLNRSQWASYRQALRDITTQVGFPDNVVWPTAPSLPSGASSTNGIS